MNLLIILFLSICVYVSSDQKIEGYWEPSDEVCKKAWMKCHGEKKVGTYLKKYVIIQRKFWGTFIQTANKCLKK
ncbi:UNVERIFIED_CONTAM: hypothetical protein RMT77_001461 [Armadillidium vulgare]